MKEWRMGRCMVQWKSAETRSSTETYAKAEEAGMPKRSRLTMDRSKRWSQVSTESNQDMSRWQRNYILRVKAPVKLKPTRRRREATKNCVPLPTVGRNGLPDAACQTSISGESIWSGEQLVVAESRRLYESSWSSRSGHAKGTWTTKNQDSDASSLRASPDQS